MVGSSVTLYASSAIGRRIQVMEKENDASGIRSSEEVRHWCLSSIIFCNLWTWWWKYLIIQFSVSVLHLMAIPSWMNVFFSFCQLNEWQVFTSVSVLHLCGCAGVYYLNGVCVQCVSVFSFCCKQCIPGKLYFSISELCSNSQWMHCQH